MSIRDELKFIAENEPHLTEKQRQIGGQIMKESRNRLQFLQSVGLDYLTLARDVYKRQEYTWLTKHKRVDGTMYSCTSLGVKLANELARRGTGKTVYILDEPTTCLLYTSRCV